MLRKALNLILTYLLIGVGIRLNSAGTIGRGILDTI